MVTYVSVPDPGGGYGLLELDEPGNSDESVAPEVAEGGYSMLLEEIVIVEYVSVSVSVPGGYGLLELEELGSSDESV